MRTVLRPLGWLLVVSLACVAANAQNPKWQSSFTHGYCDVTKAVAADGAGGVYACGFTFDSLYVFPQRAWCRRISASGAELWEIELTNVGGKVHADAVATSTCGGVFVCGDNLSAGNLSSGWIAFYDASGNPVWRHHFGTLGWDRATGVASDGMGGVYVCASVQAGTPLDLDSSLSRYDAAGNLLWSRQFGTPEADYVYDAASDGAGGVYLCGSTWGDFEPSAPGEMDDAWLARFDSSGNRLWIRQIGTWGREIAFSVGQDGTRGAFLCGWTYGNLAAPNAGYFDAWFARYDAAGNQTWMWDPLESTCRHASLSIL